MQEPEITDVEFTEIKKEDVKQIFNPAVFLTEALIAAGLNDAALKWSIGIDPRVETAESEKDRIFFANRALRLFLAEVEDRENITPRMLLADGIDSVKWCALMEQGVIPWLLNQFDKKGKRVTGEEQADTVIRNGNEVPAEQWDPTGELITQRDETGFVEQPPVWEGSADQAPVVIGIDEASGPDQTAHMPVKWDVPILKGDQIPDSQEDGHFVQEGAPADDGGEER